ncbi:signal peptidase II [Cellulomonas marina]|uniref:Lipoprotein signal peptidase n=1 Tax=Cellulomonas marina TaxID=988821 RepID=A0A1I0VME9_9CELL|nr:hypothetical protein Cma02nite_04930 [Cellulomonas marina]SFA77173.1 signal peptidase II [Cellulomonas marina]
MPDAPDAADDARATTPSAGVDGGATDPVDADGATADAATVPPARRRRLLAGLVVLAAAVLAADQLSKAWALDALSTSQRRPVLGDLLGLQLVFNPGAALSIATGLTWVLTLVAVVVVLVVARAARRIGSGAWAVALGLLLGGALGNLGDRLFRPPGFARGHVVDFLAYGDFFVGNVADIAIVAAAVLVVLLAVRGTGLDGRRAGA